LQGFDKLSPDGPKGRVQEPLALSLSKGGERRKRP
jgi:hypothetical protein